MCCLFAPKKKAANFIDHLATVYVKYTKSNIVSRDQFIVLRFYSSHVLHLNNVTMRHFPVTIVVVSM